MVGTLVRDRRLAKGLTQLELSQKSGLRQTYISQVEKGEIAMPRDHNLDALGGVLGITRAEFYRAAGYWQPPVGQDGDVFDRAPISRLVAMLNDLPVGPGQPSFAEQLQQLDNLKPAARDRVIRRVARDFLHSLRQELEREEGQGE